MRIHPRFCGPPGSANGGYTCGLIAKHLSGPVEVTLRAPPPLDTELSLLSGQGGLELKAPDGTLLAEAKPQPFSLELPRPVTYEEAVEASARYIGFHEHPYPGCFVCGPRREASLGSGLSLFPGALAPRADATPQGAPVNVVAAPFQPGPELCDASGSLPSELVWASLDCPSWFGHAAFLSEAAPKILLGRLTAHVRSLPKLHERCVVLGFGLGQEGRRILCGSALYGADGECLAYAKATWIALKDA